MTYLLIGFLASLVALVVVEFLGEKEVAMAAINALRSAVVGLGSGMVAVASKRDK